MKCSEAREMLPAYVRDGDVTLAFRRHLSRCERCTSELGQYESMMAALGGLEIATVQPPPELMANLVAIPTGGVGRLDNVRTHLARNRKIYAGSAAVALAGAAGVFALRRRGRLLAA